MKHSIVMDQEGEYFNITFQPASPDIFDVQAEHADAGPVYSSTPEKVEPVVGPRPNTNSAEFHFGT